MIQAEITPYMRVILPPGKRILLAILNAGAIGLMCFVFYRCAERASRADQKVPDSSMSSVKRNIATAQMSESAPFT